MSNLRYNTGWSINKLAKEYKKEHPEWSNNKCKDKAKIIYNELNSMHKEYYLDGKNYFDYNLPFSLIEDLEEDNIEVIQDLEIYKNQQEEIYNNKIIKNILSKDNFEEELDILIKRRR